jgi:hypothetical protein
LSHRADYENVKSGKGNDSPDAKINKTISRIQMVQQHHALRLALHPLSLEKSHQRQLSIAKTCR